jgi:hypothetical protein
MTKKFAVAIVCALLSAAATASAAPTPEDLIYACLLQTTPCRDDILEAATNKFRSEGRIGENEKFSNVMRDGQSTVVIINPKGSTRPLPPRPVTTNYGTRGLP